MVWRKRGLLLVGRGVGLESDAPSKYWLLAAMMLLLSSSVALFEL